ncbi:MAG: signal peptidase I [Dehalococcoidales bacterium]|nr:MAG: signal peptidase I [Dehalococcoidales bacterium]
MVKIIGWSISILLVLVVVALVFVYFSPDYNVYLVKGQSMAPVINVGDMVVTGPVEGPLGGEIKPGIIVTYQDGSSSVTHRVIAVEGDSLITKGDASEDPDSSSVPISEIGGVYLFRIPYIGYLSDFMRTTVGWLVVVIVPAILLVVFLVRRIVREATGTA